MKRMLGLDLGDRRIGLALADLGSGEPRARPYATIRRRRDVAGDIESLGRVVKERGIVELVVGLPLEAVSGDEGPQAQATRAWAEAVAKALDLPLCLRDERLTSRRAEERIGPARRGRAGGPPTSAQRDAHRARVDREAAALILQDELDSRAAGNPERGL
jgi:putative Holliday junction resolvase